MRIMIKGGIWKNIEDEILKAAVMKYGLNQWSRISSLLVRKSAKQCKARWYEWLDPSIKKTEWSREEEEKLLHLAKLFPNQWRTIAPIIGRTPAQCIEHYELLLEQAQGQEAIPDENDPRKLRPGEIDPQPETRPPRPDPVDMDEDEKEMLQEARARLSNTRGKKAKRKAREKQLEEARRLAVLERKREIRAAGINIELKKRIKPKIKEIDYNTEVPFQHEVPDGTFEPGSDEDPELTRDRMMIAAQQIEANMRDEIEAIRKEQDERKMRKLKELDMPKAVSKINSASEIPLPVKKMKLTLPAPQMTEQALDEFAKLGVQGGNGDQPTDALLGNYNQEVAPAQIVTPKGDDTLMTEARNAIALSRTTTPLLGGENLPLHHPDFSGLTPQHKTLPSPNPLLNRLTPSRDPMSINTPLGSDSFPMPAKLTQKNLEKLKQEQEQYLLTRSLKDLPKPENEYSFEIPEVEEEPETETLIEIEEKPTEEVSLYLDSEVVKRNLPRPVSFNPKKFLEHNNDLISEEIVTLVQYDMYNHPMKGTKQPPTCPDKELISEELYQDARRLIENEIKSEGDAESAIEAAYDKVRIDVMNKGVVMKEHQTEEQRQSLAKSEYKILNIHYSHNTSSTSEVENKIKEITKSYQKAAVKYEREIEKLYRMWDTLRIENSVFSALLDQEKQASKFRLESLQNLVLEEKNRSERLIEEIVELKKQKEGWEWVE